MRTGLVCGAAAIALTAILASSCSPASPPSGSKPAETAATPATIMQFYASPATIAKGDRTLLCYGVEGAASVRLEPAVEEIALSRARCLEVKPAASTTYTLFAKDKAGAEVSKKIDVVIDPKLHAAAPVGAPAGGGLILFFMAAPPGKIAKGSAVTLCYGVKGASAVSISPPVQNLVPSERLCFQARPEADTNYVLTATSAAGAKDMETVRVKVE